MCHGETCWSRCVRPVTCRPAMPEKRAWWKTPTRGSVLAWRPSCEGLAGVQADRGDRGEHADLRLPGLEPQPFGLDVEAVAPVDRGDLESGVAQTLGDRVGGGPDELDGAGHLPLGLDLLGDPGDRRVDADQPGLLPEAQQRRPALGGIAAAPGDVHLAAELAPFGLVRAALRRRERHRHPGDRHRAPRALRGAAWRAAEHPRASRAPARGLRRAALRPVVQVAP